MAAKAKNARALQAALQSAARGGRQAAAMLLSLLVVVCLPVVVLEPAMAPRLHAWGRSASEDGYQVHASLAMLIAALSVVPGVPTLSMVAILGTMLPFLEALLVATCARHAAACLCFFIGRHCLQSYVDAWEQRYSMLVPVRRAVSSEPWKMTLLSRFIMLPEQVKNYSLGALAVRFSPFFWMTLVGDLQGTVFAIVFGSASHVQHEPGRGLDVASEVSSSFLSAAAMVASLVLMMGASVYAKRVHLRFSEAAPSPEDAWSIKSRGGALKPLVARRPRTLTGSGAMGPSGERRARTNSLLYATAV